MLRHTVYSKIVNPFHATGLFLYPLKKLENLWFFKGFSKQPAAWNVLMKILEKCANGTVYLNSSSLTLAKQKNLSRKGDPLSHLWH